MKILTLFALGVCVLLTVIEPVIGQIANPGFEQWTAGAPNGWSPNNITGFAVPITQSSTSHSGSFSAQGEVVSFAGNPYPPLLSSLFPVSQRHATLNFWLQFLPIGGDGAAVSIVMFKDQQIIGAGGGETYEASAWGMVNIEILYIDGQVPDSCYVSFVLTGDSLGNPNHVGSLWRLDDLSFSGISAIGEVSELPTAYRLNQNFPNPFNPSTTITYELPASGDVVLKVYNLVGQEVSTLVDEFQVAGSKSVRFDAAGLPSGVYTYRLNVNGRSQAKQMMFLK
ncbi:MAG: T9SS type A sorting domain-containing protein [Bacteroidota bacterium]